MLLLILSRLLSRIRRAKTSACAVAVAPVSSATAASADDADVAKRPFHTNCSTTAAAATAPGVPCSSIHGCPEQ